MTEHSVVYELTGGERTITRQIWQERDGRFLGSERIRETRWNGYDGWSWSEKPEGSFQFASKIEAAEWMDEMFREKDVANARTALDRARAAWERSQPQLFLEV